MKEYLFLAGFGVAGLVVLWVGFRFLQRSLRRSIWMKRHQHQEFVDTMMQGQIARGMSLDMVLDVWGTPADMDETVMKTKTKRELKYDQKGKNRFGTRVYFENGEVVGWETK